MLTNPLIDQLKKLKFHGMSEAFSEQIGDSSINALSFDERLSLLIDRECGHRANRMLQNRLKQAKLHISSATISDINYRKDRQIDKKQMAYLADGEWLRQNQNLLLTGATGTGKTYIACALAHKACMLGYRVQYWRVTRLLEELDLAKSDGRYLSVIKSLAKFKIIVLDDWAMVKVKGKQQQFILDVLDDRYQSGSVIVTSQVPVTSWYEQIEDPTFADTILDRMIGQAQIIQLSGASMRRKDQSNISA